MLKRINIYLFHFFGWLAFGIYYFMPIFNLVIDPHQANRRHGERGHGGMHFWDISPELFLAQSIFHFATLLVVFYINYYILLPRFLASKKLTLFITGCLLVILSIVFLDHFIIEYFRSVLGDIKEFRRFSSFGYSVSLFLSLAVSISIKMIWVWFEGEKQKTILRNQQLSTELALLKSQINPHFLFNSLNNIRSLVRKKSEHSETAILKLSDMMRYVLHESEKDKVLIGKELSYINDFIDLQRLRIADGIEIEVVENIVDENVEIAPMLLLPLIENAFKHGISYRKASFVKINIGVKDLKLKLQVLNTIHTSTDLENESSGLGLVNLKRRLEILYHDQYYLKTESVDNIFYSNLTIQLNHANLSTD